MIPNGFISGALMFSVLWALFQEFAQVVVLEEADNPTLVDGEFEADITGYKIKNCPLVRGTSIGWYESGGNWVEIPSISFLGDKTPDSSNPVGKTNFGRWQWPLVPSDATRVRMTALSDCMFGLQVTTVGPFVINREEIAGNANNNRSW